MNEYYEEWMIVMEELDELCCLVEIEKNWMNYFEDEINWLKKEREENCCKEDDYVRKYVLERNMLEMELFVVY